MKVDMLASQFDVLEEPWDAIVVEISQPADALVDQVLTACTGSLISLIRALHDSPDDRQVDVMKAVIGRCRT